MAAFGWGRNGLVWDCFVVWVVSRFGVMGDVVDPVCGRGSSEVLEFSVGGRSWGVVWGDYLAFGSAAYWVDQTVRNGYEGRVEEFVVNTDLRSELVFCLLGGFGVTAESAAAAHGVVMGVVGSVPVPDAELLEAVLRDPLPGGLGRYRFPRQRAMRVSAALRRLEGSVPPSEPGKLREFLLGFSGVGPKTSAWVVRNVTGSPDVAIVDVWLVRALTAIGVFPSGWDVRRHYGWYEEAFLLYAGFGGVSPAALDLCVWEQARERGVGFFRSRVSEVPGLW